MKFPIPASHRVELDSNFLWFRSSSGGKGSKISKINEGSKGSEVEDNKDS